MQKLGVVTAYGKTRATLYYLAQAQAEQKEETVKEQDEDLIPLSNEGKEIRKLVMQPVARRRPVGYNIDFLTSYRPNVDSYLTLDDKRKLTKLGDTARLDQPAGTYAREILQRP